MQECIVWDVPGGDVKVTTPSTPKSIRTPMKVKITLKHPMAKARVERKLHDIVTQLKLNTSPCNDLSPPPPSPLFASRREVNTEFTKLSSRFVKEATLTFCNPHEHPPPSFLVATTMFNHFDRGDSTIFRMLQHTMVFMSLWERLPRG